MPDAGGVSPAAITVTTSRRARPGSERELDAWLREGHALVQASPGFLGAGWLKPAPGESTWQVLYRFADEDALHDWERSDARAAWLAGADRLVEATSTERRSGLEGWFSSEPVGGPPVPPRWKQAVAIWLGFFPTSLLAAYVLLPHLTALPTVPRTLVSTLCLTPVMVFLVLPRVTAALRPWLQR